MIIYIYRNTKHYIMRKFNENLIKSLCNHIFLVPTYNYYFFHMKSLSLSIPRTPPSSSKKMLSHIKSFLSYNLIIPGRTI